MIMTLKIDCVFSCRPFDTCVRLVETDEDASLLDLHNIVQDAVDFGRDHPFEFFIANGPLPTARRKWITMAEEWEEKVAVFSSTKLKDVHPVGRKRLYYIFDAGDQWTFDIRRLRGTKEPEEGATYPRVIEAVGPNPKQ